MPISYVDEVVVRFLMKKGYLVTQGIWFQTPKEKTGKKVSGWSDIDIFAVKSGEPPLIIQCKSFAGTKKSDQATKDIINWFNNAINFLKNDQNSNYKSWFNQEPTKIFVVDSSVKKIEKGL